MPIYEYVCEDCHKHYEKIVLERAPGELVCPECASPKQILQFSVFSSPGGSVNGAIGSGASCACTPVTCGCPAKN